MPGFAGLRALVYSGDRDGILGVPWPGSQTWTYLVGQNLGLAPNGNWTDWYLPDPDNFGDQVRTIQRRHSANLLAFAWLTAMIEA